MVDIEDIREYFAEELRRRMECEGLYPRDIAYHCEIKSELVYNYLRGSAFPNPWRLSLIADLFTCTTNELLDFDEPDDDSLLGYDPKDMFEDEEEFTMHFRNRLDLYMSDSGMSIPDLSFKTGFNEYTIKRWLGKLQQSPTLPRTSDVLVLCDALCCTPSDLLGY